VHVEEAGDEEAHLFTEFEKKDGAKETKASLK